MQTIVCGKIKTTIISIMMLCLLSFSHSLLASNVMGTQFNINNTYTTTNVGKSPSNTNTYTTIVDHFMGSWYSNEPLNLIRRDGAIIISINALWSYLSKA